MNSIWWIHASPHDPAQPTVLATFTEAKKFVLDHPEGCTIPEMSKVLSSEEERRLDETGDKWPQEPYPQGAIVNEPLWNGGRPVKRLCSSQYDTQNYIDTCKTIVEQMKIGTISAAGDDYGLIRLLMK